MPAPNARFRLLPTVLLVSSLFAVPLSAQDPAAPSPPPGGAGRPGAPGGRGMAADPTLVDGPILPEEFAASAKLDSKQESRYASLYQNLMSSTKADRDAVRAARDKMRAAREAGQGGGQSGGGGRDQMRADREKLRPAMDNLRQSQDAFDRSLKEFLTPDQLKAYDDWKESKRAEMRAQFGGGGRRP